jgi:hypothetical protein
MNSIRKISIVKLDNKYYIYTPAVKSDNMRDKLCRWWGEFDTFYEVYNKYEEKLKEYDSLDADYSVIRKVKLLKIKSKIKSKEILNGK